MNRAGRIFCHGQPDKNMNETNVRNPSRSHRLPWLAGLLTAAVFGVTACQTSPPAPLTPKDFSGFLGDYSRLVRGNENEASFIYIDTAVSFAKYSKVFLQPVELWKSTAPDSLLSRLSPQSQQMLVSYFHTALFQALEKSYQIVNYAGPDVLVVHAAFTEASPAQPVSVLSGIVPDGMAASLSKQRVAGVGSRPGSGPGLVMVEVEFLDGQTGQRVAAAVDARAATKALRNNTTSTWRDVQVAFDWWAQRLVKRMALLKQGVFTAAPM